jgi:hypothetical protein
MRNAVYVRGRMNKEFLRSAWRIDLKRPTIKITEQSDFRKYSIFNIQFRLARAMAGMTYVKIIVNIFGIGKQPVTPDASAVKTSGGC